MSKKNEWKISLCASTATVEQHMHYAAAELFKSVVAVGGETCRAYRAASQAHLSVCT